MAINRVSSERNQSGEIFTHCSFAAKITGLVLSSLFETKRAIEVKISLNDANNAFDYRN